MDMPDTGLAYVGKVIALDPIPDADFIVSATVVCGKGGKWQGVVQKGAFQIGAHCMAFMPDALLPESDEYRFMEKHKWRVRMCRFRGAPSEVLILQPSPLSTACAIGSDLTLHLGVKKYFKPIPACLDFTAISAFPQFIPKTDEPNYQCVSQSIDLLQGHPYYITDKYDGSSTTAYKVDGVLHVACRNWDMLEEEKNGYWKVANKYNLKEKLPDGVALQWETCGPKINCNNHGLREAGGFAFSAYDMVNHRYLEMLELFRLCDSIGFPRVRTVGIGDCFQYSKDIVALMGEGEYPNGHIREGVVVRSQHNVLGHQPISFKVINLGYET